MLSDMFMGILKVPTILMHVNYGGETLSSKISDYHSGIHMPRDEHGYTPRYLAS